MCKLFQRQQVCGRQIQTHGGAAIDIQGLAKVIVRKLVLLLPIIHIPKSIPCIIVPWICTNSSAEALQPAIIFVIGDVLVPCKSVSVRIVGSNLNCTNEKF